MTTSSICGGATATSTPDWDPTKIVEPWDTVAEEIEPITKSIEDAGHDAIAVNIEDRFDTLLVGARPRAARRRA